MHRMWARFVGACRIVRLSAIALGLMAAVPNISAWDSARWIGRAQGLGAQAATIARAFDAMLASAAAQTDVERRLVLVNQFFNQHISFTTDESAWGQVDYWASPMEALIHGQGDCEDFAIGKYFTLVATGVPVAQLRLVYVKALLGGTGQPESGVVQAHMVLAYYSSPSADPWVLDNLIGDVVPASHRPDLTPVFSFNGEGLWHGTQGAAAGDPTIRLSRWRDVLAKAAVEGF